MGYFVAKGHSVTLGGIKFRGGKRLPDNRDYSGLIALGYVVESTDAKAGSNIRVEVSNVNKRRGPRKKKDSATA
jgi:hypothetical protein